MAKDWYFYDTAGTRRRVKEAYLYDTAGNRRKIKEGYFYDAGGTRRQFFASNVDVLAGTLFAVADGSAIGYRESLDGDIVPMLQINGGICSRMYTQAGSLRLEFMNQTTNPGQLYFNSFSSGIGVFAASAATYTYASNNASWTWVTGAVYVNGGNYTVALNP